jgi:signal peptidase I
MKRRLFDFRSEPRERRALILACMLFWSVISYLLISRFALETGEVVGESMVPTLNDGEHFLINRWIFRFRDPRAGDIVALRMPDDEDLTVKRIIALPRDLVQIKNGFVFVNGKKLSEPYVPTNIQTVGEQLSDKVFKVEDNCYFVLGDNRPKSEDSRMFGAVPQDWLVGRVRVNESQGTRGHL